MHQDGAVPRTPAPAGEDTITLQRLVEEHTDPHGLYDALRARDRVSFDPASRCWVVTGHGAARAILSDARFVSDAALAMPQARRPARRSFVTEAIQKQIIFSEGPRQERVQRAVLKELAHRSAALAPRLQASALALAQDARAAGEVDLVGDFAVPFSLEAISLILGISVDDPEEMERLEGWSTSYADLTSGYLHASTDDVARLAEYFRARVAERGGTPSDDLIGAFMRDGGLDDEDDLVIQCMMAFAAGRVTTQKLLGDGIPRLIPAWGAWREMARATPSGVRRLTEELLRLVTPTRYVTRFAMEDVDLPADVAEGAHVARGQKVVLVLEAANRDERAFAAPHALEPERQPNPHVTFGFGPHRCPGASIARVEIQAALHALLQELADLRPHPSLAPAWDPNPNLGGYSSYPCVCG